MNIPISGAFIPIPSPWNRGEPCFNGLVCGKIYRKPGFLTWNVWESGFKCPLNPSSDWCATHLPASAGRWVRSSKAPVAHRATMASLINFLGAAKFYGSEVLCAYLKWPFLNPCMSIWILHRCICIDIHMYYNMYYICITYVLHMYNTSCGMERKDLRKCTLFPSWLSMMLPIWGTIMGLWKPKYCDQGGKSPSFLVQNQVHRKDHICMGPLQNSRWIPLWGRQHYVLNIYIYVIISILELVHVGSNPCAMCESVFNGD